MPDDSNKVWIDITFNSDIDPEPKLGTQDVPHQIQLADAENIGSYSMPVIYNQEDSTSTGTDVWLQYFNEPTLISGVDNVAGEYFGYNAYLNGGVYLSLVEFMSGRKDLYGTVGTEHIYSTGFNSVSGSLNEVVTFIGGREMPAVDNIPTFYSANATTSGIMEWWVNYTNFSGNLSVPSGIPIPFHEDTFSYQAVYGADYTTTSGFLDKIVDVSFAGWVDYPVYGDVYASMLGFRKGYDSEATVISGSIGPHYLDFFSSTMTTSGVEADVYCALTDYSQIFGEAETIKGRNSYLETSIYSTVETVPAISMDIDLFSLKISNFSLGEGEFTTASGFISVDVTDDECPVSTSGTYFKVDGIQVPVTFYEIVNGYRMYYDPLDDFSSIEGPTTFTAHAENECDDVLEVDYYLTFGYIVEYKNHSSYGIDYGYDNKVAVRVIAENYASCPQISSLAWDFQSIELANVDLGASIVGRPYGCESGELSAEVYPDSTAYFYGKEFRVVVKTKDFVGNGMEPLVLSYKIENKPEN